ncbi:MULTISPECIES: hypothetical protein [unclassified Kribbella]|uniref:hypothetical protein n=1 Tax=unclassified Kribbella TaxID=2644121 RepID=UPI0030189FB4
MSEHVPQSPGHATDPERSRPQSVRGRVTTGSKVWFVWMVGMWVAFFVLLRADRLDALASSIRDLPWFAEIFVWLLFFPWVLGTAVWTGDLSESVRVLLVVIFAAGWTIVSIPRPKKPTTPQTRKPVNH